VGRGQEVTDLQLGARWHLAAHKALGVALSAPVLPHWILGVPTPSESTLPDPWGNCPRYWAPSENNWGLAPKWARASSGLQAIMSVLHSPLHLNEVSRGVDPPRQFTFSYSTLSAPLLHSISRDPNDPAFGNGLNRADELSV
jgi:hypothetical protein